MINYKGEKLISVEICSIQEFITVIEKLKRNYSFSDERFSKKNRFTPKFVYRGHSNHADFKLLPGCLRTVNIGDTSYSQYSILELNTLETFISEGCRYNSTPIDDYHAWLEIAQHFGVPTRLLDFTENPLVALYFACVDSGDIDGSVWIVNEKNYRMNFYKEPPVTKEKDSKLIISSIIQNEILNFNLKYDSNSDIKYPWIYKPYYREERMMHQASIFMLWGCKRNCFESFMKSENLMSTDKSVNNEKKGILIPILIPHNYKKTILKQLEDLGISEKFIYPGLDGIGRYVKRKNSIKKF